jgi:hypothetical protein
MDSFQEHKLGWRCGMDQMDGEQLNNVQKDFISPPTIYRDFVTRFERTKGALKVGDIWIPKCVIFPNHFM